MEKSVLCSTSASNRWCLSYFNINSLTRANHVSWRLKFINIWKYCLIDLEQSAVARTTTVRFSIRASVTWRGTDRQTKRETERGSCWYPCWELFEFVCSGTLSWQRQKSGSAPVLLLSNGIQNSKIVSKMRIHCWLYIHEICYIDWLSVIINCFLTFVSNHVTFFLVVQFSSVTTLSLKGLKFFVWHRIED